MTRLFVIQRDGTVELYKTITDKSEVITHVSEEKFQELKESVTKRVKEKVEEILS